jgi:hypothetical protein
MLGGDEHGVHAAWPPIGVVLDRDLALPVRAQVRQRPIPAHLGQAPRDTVREHDRHRHQLVRFVGGISEHHSLVACAQLIGLDAVTGLERVVDPSCDVGRLFLDGGHGAARLPVEAEAAVVVPDLAHRAPDHFLHVDVVARRDLSKDDDHARRGRHLDRAARVRIVLQDVIQDRVGDGVAQLVRMTLGDRFGGEEDRRRGV